MNYDSTFSLNCSFNTLLDTFCNFTRVSEQYCWVCARRGDIVLKGFWKEINTDENSSDCSYSICGMSPWPLSGDLKIAFCAFTGQGTKEKKKEPKDENPKMFKILLYETLLLSKKLRVSRNW